MTLDMDIGVVLTIGITAVGAWWGLAKMFFSQFEKRQNERFDELNVAIAGQEEKLDGHLNKQDEREKNLLHELRKVDERISLAQIDAAKTYQTKDEAGKQFSQLIQEIRGLGTRIDALHRNSQ
jgi:hypothetical protein